MSNLFFYTGVTVFVLGVLIGTVFVIEAVYVWWLVVLGVGLCSVACGRGEASATRNVLLGGVALLLFATGALKAVYYEAGLQSSVLTQYADEEVLLTGVITREVERREKTAHVYIETEYGIVLAYADRYADVQYGDRVEAQGALQVPEQFVTDLGRTFNYSGYLKAKRVTHVLYYPELVVLERGVGNVFFETLYAVKHAFQTQVQELISAPQSSLGEGLLLGINGVLGERWEEVFRKTGIIHIVVLSGYNVMLVIVFVQYVLSYVLPYRARIIFGFGAIVLFALLVGLSATVVRASVMASLLLLLQFSGNAYNILRGLFLAGVIMLLWNPLLLLYDPGFQLSFLATLGLILLAPHIERIVQFMPQIVKMREFLVATLATQLFVLPFLLYQIGELSIVAVLVNMLVLPMVPVAMFLTFFAGVIGFVAPTLALLVGALAEVSLTYILRVAELFAQVPFASVVVPAFGFWVVLIGYTLLGWWVYRLHNPSKHTRYLRGWTIEEEEVLLQRIKEAPQSDASSAPVFFR